MLNEQGFDLWANGYDRSVDASYESDEYPFAGYKEILNHIFNKVMQKPNSSVLDVGIGTGVLSEKLYANGHQITGIDFSENMLKIVSKKMEHATLIKHDFSSGMPKEIESYTFNFIIFTYSIHHLTDDMKSRLLNSLRKYLSPDGAIIIGDISFEKSIDLASCQNEFASIWDNSEHYYCYDNIKNKLIFANKFYSQISICGGLLILSD